MSIFLRSYPNAPVSWYEIFFIQFIYTLKAYAGQEMKLFLRYNEVMQDDSDWKMKFTRELQHAEEARARGNEGMARVCARRAAGIAVGEYLQQHDLPSPGPSAYDRLRSLRDLPSVPTGAREAAGYLLTRITVDGELPVEVDLVSEARRMVNELFGSRL